QNSEMNWKPLFNRAILLISALCVLSSELSASDYHSTEVKHGGTIRGLVKFATETPPRAMFGTRGDDQCPAGIPQEQLLVKQENRGIQNVLIVLDIHEGKPLPAVKAHIDSQGCRFVPRIQWVAKGSSVMVTAHDPAVHSIRALRQNVAKFSVTLQPKDPPARRPLVETGLYKINDDKHLWMRAW